MQKIVPAFLDGDRQRTAIGTDREITVISLLRQQPLLIWTGDSQQTLGGIVRQLASSSNDSLVALTYIRQAMDKPPQNDQSKTWMQQTHSSLTFKQKRTQLPTTVGSDLLESTTVNFPRSCDWPGCCNMEPHHPIHGR